MRRACLAAWLACAALPAAADCEFHNDGEITNPFEAGCGDVLFTYTDSDTAGTDIVVLDARSGQQTGRITLARPEPVSDAVWSRDGRSILVGAESEGDGKNEDGPGAIRAEVGA